jgi:hypothetical protein
MVAVVNVCTCAEQGSNPLTEGATDLIEKGRKELLLAKLGNEALHAGKWAPRAFESGRSTVDDPAVVEWERAVVCEELFPSLSMDAEDVEEVGLIGARERQAAVVSSCMSRHTGSKHDERG